MLRRLTILLCVALSTAAAQKKPSAQVQALQKEIQSYLDERAFDNSTWGILVQSVQNGETLFALNAKRNFIPASNRKLFTSIFDLDQLGPDFQYTTKVFLQGHMENDSVFAGNIIIRGMGDPSISGRFNEGRITQILEDWCDSLRQRRIKTVRGRIIGDDNFLGDDVLGSFWEWDGESFWYSAQLSGLSFNDNCIDWYVSPAKVGEPAAIRLVPNTQYIKVNNFVKTVPSAAEAHKVELYRRRATNEVDAVGAVLAGSDPQHGYVTMENPTLYTVSVLQEILAGKGISVDSGVADMDAMPGFSYKTSDSNVTTIATHRSPKLSELIKIINKNSQNFYAEQIWRTVAAVKDSVGTGERALELEKKFLKSAGLNPDRMSLADGSGYARGTLVTPTDIVTILKWIRNHKYWKTFWESLPIAGVDGTLKARLKDTMAENNARAKTGYLDNVKTISGFVKTLDGEDLVFSIMCNNFTIDKAEIERVQDQIVGSLSFFTRN